jgi:co-chaperonin GroES (HSP10)
MTKFSEVPQFILTNFFSILKEDEQSSEYGILDDIIVANEISEINLIIKTNAQYKKATLTKVTSVNENEIFFNEEDLLTSASFSNGDEIYFKKYESFYDYVKTNKQYADYVNVNKKLLYIGKIYKHTESSYSIKYYNLYDFVINALPQYIINNNPKLKEFLYVVFNKNYSEVYSKQKNINSLISPQEISKDFLYNYAYNFGLDIDEEFILLHSEKIRQFLDNIVSFLKKKGTYSSINVNKQIIFFNSLNKLNVYDR